MIQTDRLSKQFGDQWVVEDVNLEVKPGQVFALLGQNGAGKTTTIRMLASILAPSKGTARVMGFDVTQAPQKVRSMIGVLTEQHGLYLRMTGREYLEFFGKVYQLNQATRKKRSDDLFGYFNLTEAAMLPIGKYSKGMRQKLALARSLIHDPPVLLLDEPTSAMDPESALLVRNAIHNLRNENRAIIICTHNLMEAELLADTIGIIHRGKILIMGTVAELKNKLLGPMEFLVTLKDLPHNLSPDYPKGVSSVRLNGNELRFIVEDPYATNPLFIKYLISQDLEIISMQEAPRSLETAYLEAIRQASNV